MLNIKRKENILAYYVSKFYARKVLMNDIPLSTRRTEIDIVQIKTLLENKQHYDRK